MQSPSQIAAKASLDLFDYMNSNQGKNLSKDAKYQKLRGAYFAALADIERLEKLAEAVAFVSAA